MAFKLSVGFEYGPQPLFMGLVSTETIGGHFLPISDNRPRRERLRKERRELREALDRAAGLLVDLEPTPEVKQFRKEIRQARKAVKYHTVEKPNPIDTIRSIATSMVIWTATDTVLRVIVDQLVDAIEQYIDEL